MIGRGRRRQKDCSTAQQQQQSRESHYQAHQFVLADNARHHNHVLPRNARFAGQETDQFVVRLALFGHGGHFHFDCAVVENAAPFSLRTLGNDPDLQRKLLGGGEQSTTGQIRRLPSLLQGSDLSSILA